MERVESGDPNEEKFDINQLIQSLRDNESAKSKYEIIGTPQ